MAEDKLGETKAIRLELSLPCDVRFRPVLAAMSEKMAEYVGFAKSEATEIAETVVCATDGVFDDDAPSAYSTLDVTFSTNDQEMEIRVRYVCEGTAGGDAGGLGIERLLSQRGESDAPLDVMQRVMGRVEFGRDAGAEVCTLAKLLPRQASGRDSPDTGHE